MTAIAGEKVGSDAVRTPLAGVPGWHVLVLALVVSLVGAPLILLVLGSFSTASIPTEFSWATLGLANYRQVWLDPRTYDVVGNTFVYVFGATFCGVAIATALAFLVERSDMPGKLWFYALVPMTLAIPGMLQAMAWVLLFSPRIGFVNVFFERLFGSQEPLFNVYSMGGMIVVEGLRLVPTAFLMLVPLFRSMDPSLEEAAATSGAGPGATFRKVTLRLMLPGLLAVIIFQGMTALEVFEVPGILGFPGDIYVFSTKIYALIHASSGTPAYGPANALAIVYVVIAVVATWLYSRVIARSGRFMVVSGKSYRPRRMQLGGWRGPALTLGIVFLFFSVALPFVVLVYVSFLPYLQAPSVAAFHAMSLRNYRELWNADDFGTVLGNTATMIVLTSTATLILSFIVSMIVVRSQFRGRRLLDQLAFIPHAVPGIVMGLAFFWVFLEIDKAGVSIHGGVLAISICFTVGFMAYGTRSMNAALLQIHKDLDEAARVSGAANWQIVARVYVPLLLPTIAGVWIWTMLQSVRLASVPLILYEGSDNQVLSVFVWNLWSHGSIGVAGAVGTLTVTALLLISLALRVCGFGRVGSPAAAS